ncbi:uncharacterized protein [Diadema antillarum]|uniref:uncharacterized protein n=1 Tax=Diadema antillarum TaxID=105358 RepID=UPI003A84DAA8
MGDRDFDDILKAVASDVHDDSAIEDLGKALGFRLGEISTFLKTNMRYGEVTNRGTLQMLRKWQQNVSKAEERSLLRQKLIAAGLRRVADDHLPGAVHSAAGQTQSQASRAPAQAATSPIVTDNQIIKLSNILPGGNYTSLAVALDVSLAESSNIKRQHLLDNRAATIEVLSAWKTRTGGRIDELDQALREAQCAGLIDQYKN